MRESAVKKVFHSSYGVSFNIGTWRINRIGGFSANSKTYSTYMLITIGGVR
jgi:hypothetical protein